jgi:AcrR family transcriptional regulator
MPRRTVFSREEIVQVAFELVDEKGRNRLTARGVADRMSASTAPVYSNFKSMDELARAVMLRSRDILQEYATAPHTEHVFLNMGIGIIKFARDHRHLFREMFLETAEYQDILTELRESLLDVMGQDESLDALALSQKDELLFKMSVITYGIAAQVCVGLMELESDEEITDMLSIVGSAVVETALADAAAQKSPSAKDE